VSDQLEIEIPTPPDQPESLARLWAAVDVALGHAKTALLEVEETVNYALYQIPAELSADFAVIERHRAEIEKEQKELEMSIAENGEDGYPCKPTLSEERTLKILDAAIYALARLSEALGRVRAREIAEMQEAGAVVRLAGEKGGAS
jgi:hypothetical protein